MKTNKITFLMPLILLGLLSPPAYSKEDKDLANWRPYDQTGVNVFEPASEKPGEFEGLKVRFGGHFTQQLQILDHTNEASLVYNADSSANTNELLPISPGFNTATANLNMDAMLTDEIRLNLVLYLSSRHHVEAWVKGGYLQIDGARFLKSPFINKMMKYITLKVGHYEINYGDQHFRRTDNANAMYNPFVGNLIMDAFTTEIGGELYAKNLGGAIFMAGVTGGEIKGDVTKPDQRAPSIYGKLGYDNQVNELVRVRLTGSTYFTDKSASNTLFGGDRTGSRYYLVLENTGASTSGNAFSGRFNPGFRDNVLAFQINPFLKVAGIEVFGTYDWAQGSAANETEDRVWQQVAGEAVYRFLKNEQLYLGARLNRAFGELAGSGIEAAIDRVQVAAGWYITKNILAKAEYVLQKYSDFPSSDIRNEGQFDGVMVEGVVGF